MKKQDLSLRSISASNIKKKRKELGWSQEKLAEKAGLHVNHIGYIEREEKTATLDVIEKISRGLGCSAIELLTLED